MSVRASSMSELAEFLGRAQDIVNRYSAVSPGELIAFESDLLCAVGTVQRLEEAFGLMLIGLRKMISEKSK